MAKNLFDKLINKALILGTFAVAVSVGKAAASNNVSPIEVLKYFVNPHQTTRDNRQNNDSQLEKTIINNPHTPSSETPKETPTQKIEALDNSLDYRSTYVMVKRHEGLELKAYDDSKGIRTVGIGFNLTRSGARARIESLGLDYSKVYNKKVEITVEQAERLFVDDFDNSIKIAENYVGSDKWGSLPRDVKGVVVDMSYNLGPTKLAGFKKFREALRTGDFKSAADEMVDSEWYGQVGNRSKELVGIVRGYSTR
ncbi:hypothetical protein COU61_00365 [Candidatus Pacearchaeota archaeon CG10_big_fil_rev_8_21_14_0_10_35_13]|nr:MAG: hypothetical protein COU61_00365 [Candidatus Pacearchaeota archaeon CG10_big_fil_rev_8_21_14_0_10_35_13]